MSDTSGIRQKGFNEPNYPASEPRGSEVLAWDTVAVPDPGNGTPVIGEEFAKVSRAASKGN